MSISFPTTCRQCGGQDPYRQDCPVCDGYGAPAVAELVRALFAPDAPELCAWPECQRQADHTTMDPIAGQIRYCAQHAGAEDSIEEARRTR